MERILDKTNAARYDVLLAKLLEEQHADQHKLDSIKAVDSNLRSEIKTLDTHSAELNTTLEQTPISEASMRQVVSRIELMQTGKEVSMSVIWKSAD